MPSVEPVSRQRTCRGLGEKLKQCTLLGFICFDLRPYQPISADNRTVVYLISIDSIIFQRPRWKVNPLFGLLYTKF